MVYRVVFDLPPDSKPPPTSVVEWVGYVPNALEAFSLYCIFLIGSKSKLVVTAAEKRKFLYQPLLCMAEMKRTALYALRDYISDGL